MRGALGEHCRRGFTSEEDLSLVGRVFGAEASVFFCGHCSLRVQALEDKRKGGQHFPSNSQPPTRHCAASCHQRQLLCSLASSEADL